MNKFQPKKYQFHLEIELSWKLINECMELIPFSYCEKINRSLVDYLTSPKNDLIFPPVQRIKTLKKITQNLRKNIFRGGIFLENKNPLQRVHKVLTNKRLCHFARRENQFNDFFSFKSFELRPDGTTRMKDLSPPYPPDLHHQLVSLLRLQLPLPLLLHASRLL